ncbi:hypothetical protein TNCV_1920621 [Trichonephila clavipes]|nr:hypothetical protein TNCV_1920621 [Trichonephila clavipes]
MKVGVCEGRVKTVAMGAQRVINLDNIGDGSFELKRDKMLIIHYERIAEYLLDLGVNGKGQSNRTSARCLGFVNGILENRLRDGQVCPDVDKELWRLGPDSSRCFWRWTSVSRCGQELWRLGPDSSGDEETRRKKGGDPKGRSRKSAPEKARAGRSGSGEENPRVLIR